MSLFVLGDLHLSLGEDKPMDVFAGWNDYVERLERNWRSLVTDSDTVVVAGEISWAMKLEETLTDFKFIDSLPGKKLFMKGNHDYWWTTKRKMDTFLSANGLNSIQILFNNAYRVGDFAVCGTRGWFLENDTPDDEKVVNREAGRLRMSIEEAKKSLEAEKTAAAEGRSVSTAAQTPVKPPETPKKAFSQAMRPVVLRKNRRRKNAETPHGKSCDPTDKAACRLGSSQLHRRWPAGETDRRIYPVLPHQS